MLMIQSCGCLVGQIDALLERTAFFVGRVILQFRQGHVQLVGEKLDRLRKGETLDVHHELDNASARLAAKEVSQVDWAARTLLAVLSTGRLPEGSVSPDDFDDPAYRSLCEALLGGESPAALMERQPDDEGRAVIGDILSISTELDDEGLMHMAQDCLKKLRREKALQKSHV